MQAFGPAARKYFTLWCLVAIVLALVAVQPRPSSDFPRYVEWEKVLISGDMFQLDTDVISPRLLPLNEHFPGSGALFALPKLLLHTAITFNESAYITGVLSTFAFWVCALVLLLDFSASSIPLTFFGLAVLLLGTHAGHVATGISSENVSVAMLSIAMASLGLRSRAPEQHLTVFRTLAFSCSAALLMAIRPNLGIYAAAGGLVLLVRLVRSGLPAPRKALLLVAAAVPAVFSVAWLALHNLWMTGDWTRPPYMFGEGAFKSLDLRHPLFGAVLFHPLHGLLLFHPLYGLGLAVLLLSWIAGRFGPEKTFYAVATVGIVGTLWLQAGWYGWWMGTDTFGARAFSTFSILLMPLVIGVVSEAAPGKTRALWLSMVVACALWPFPLLAGRIVNNVTYAGFFASYGRMAIGAFRHPEDLLAVPAVWIAARWYYGRREPLRDSRNFLAVICVLWALVVIELTLGLEQRYAWMGRYEMARVAIRAIKVAAIVLLPRALAQAVTCAGGVEHAIRRAQSFVFASVIIAFAGVVLLVGRLGVLTGLEGRTPGVQSCYAYAADFYFPSPEVTSDEYATIPGFEPQKENLARFVREARTRVRRVPAPAVPRQQCLEAAGHGGVREYWIGSLIWRTMPRP